MVSVRNFTASKKLASPNTLSNSSYICMYFSSFFAGVCSGDLVSKISFKSSFGSELFFLRLDAECKVEFLSFIAAPNSKSVVESALILSRADLLRSEKIDSNILMILEGLH